MTVLLPEDVAPGDPDHIPHHEELHVRANGLPTSTQVVNYTAVAGDASTIVEMESLGAVTFTVPPESAVPWHVGATIEVFQAAAGQVTITPGLGVSFEAPFGTKTLATGASVFLRKRAVTDRWQVSGDVTT